MIIRNNGFMRIFYKFMIKQSSIYLSTLQEQKRSLTPDLSSVERGTVFDIGYVIFIVSSEPSTFENNIVQRNGGEL